MGSGMLTKSLPTRQAQGTAIMEIMCLDECVDFCGFKARTNNDMVDFLDSAQNKFQCQNPTMYLVAAYLKTLTLIRFPLNSS